MKDSKEKQFKTVKIKPPKDYLGLQIKHISQAADDALDSIDAERSGEQLGLYCGWSKMNRAMGKFWRFNHITQLAAPSGHGKSFGINQLHDHFTDFEDILNEDRQTVFQQALNKDFAGEVVVVHFGLEMDASDEVIRNISRKVVKSHSAILSSEWNPLIESYNTLDDDEFNMIANRMHYIRNKPIYYVEFTGTTVQMYYTVQYIQSLHPDAKIIVSVDHTLLVKRGDSESGDADLISAVAYLALRLRKDFGAMVILLSQFNQDIQSVERTTTKVLHYPMTKDIYFGAKINWVCDNIWAFPYRPELFNIAKYGVNAIDTKGLVVASCIKSRKGRILECYLEDQLSIGRFTEKKIENNSENT